MLKTNTKKVMNSIRNYVFENYCNDDVEIKNANDAIEHLKEDWLDYAKQHKDPYFKYSVDEFDSWLQGLPCGLDYYASYGEAWNFLKEAMEETEEEAKRFTQEQANHRLSMLIFKLIR